MIARACTEPGAEAIDLPGMGVWPRAVVTRGNVRYAHLHPASTCATHACRRVGRGQALWNDALLTDLVAPSYARLILAASEVLGLVCGGISVGVFAIALALIFLGVGVVCGRRIFRV